MATISSEGIDQWLELLKGALDNKKELFGRSIYPGAKIVANECKRRIDALKVDNTLFAWNPHRTGITGGWKKALQESMGIAHIRKVKDGWDVKLGFDGYSKIEENRGYENGVKKWGYEKYTVWIDEKGKRHWTLNTTDKHHIPNAVIARTTEKGSSNLPPQPFMAQTITASQYEAAKAIEEEFERIFTDYIKIK